MVKKYKAKSQYKYDCIPFNQGKNKLVFFTAPASELWQMLSINRRIEDKDEGYQRTLSIARVRDIAKYVGLGNPVPISILITLDTGKFKIDKNKILLKKTPDVGWVIDGQHRLAGAHESKSNIPLPVIAFLSLPLEGQIQQFVVINKEAKGVPTSLYYDLLKHLPDKSTADQAKERATDIAQLLKTREDSPFYNRIVTITSPKRGELSLTTFVRKVAPLVLENKGILSIYSVKEQEKIIANYYSALANVFPRTFNGDNSIFFQTTGFGALLRVLPTFFSLCLKHQKAFQISDATKIFTEIKHFDFDAWKRFGTGNIAETQAADDLRSELEKSFETGTSEATSIRL